MSVVYLNRLLNYQSSSQYSQREVTSSREVATLDLPLVISDQVAKNIADVTLYTDWLGRTSYQFYLPMKYARLEPTDIITVTVSGIAHRMRIISTQMGNAGIIKVMASAEDTSTYDFYSSPGNGTELLTENNTIPLTRLELLDMPAFPADDIDKAALRMAAIGLAGNWTGTAIYRSDDGGANYGRLIDINAPAALGSASDVLASGPVHVFDDKNSVTVVLVGSGTLQNMTETAVLNGANAALLGDEIIQFKTATLIEPGKYTLGGLLRGRLGTEWAVATHSAGERFILLDGNLGKQVLPNSIIGQARHYKAVTFGNSIAAAPAVTYSFNAVGLKPYSPVHISGTRDGSSNLTIDWIRRTRIGGSWRDGVDVPLNEASEVYEVEIMNGVSVVRTITGITSPTTSYTAAQQTTDFGSAQPSVTVKIYQMSAAVGRGYPEQASV